jgi:hypothetical protein
MATVAAAAAVATVLGGVAMGIALTHRTDDETDRATVGLLHDRTGEAPEALRPLAGTSPSPEALSPEPTAPAQTQAAAVEAPTTVAAPRKAAASRAGNGSATTHAAPVAPPAPTLAIYLPSAGAVTNGGDRRAPLRASKVSAGSGEIASVTVRHSGGSAAMTREADGGYSTVVTGLTNGRTYVFTVRVCNTDYRCTDSAPVRYTPYGTPQAGGVSLTATDTGVTVSWTAAIGNAFPFEYECTVTVIGSPDDPTAPADLAVGHGAGSRSFAGRPDTTYQALKSCGNGRSTSVARSTAVHTTAASG